ncbi:MAG: glycosyltransferase family 2 protein [Candidatus Saganbacteria bacterium]|nr:glycosyltransferase family 2 protein [Candidatus Saganbacteria bacterium]
MNYSNISIFFPAFNEESSIEKTVSKALGVAPSLFSGFEIIIVDDGSRDKTGEIIGLLSRHNKNVRAVHHSINKGYGAALKSGFAASSKELIFYTDGDGQFDISEIRNLLPYLKEADLVIGYRIKRSDPWYRLLFAKMYGFAIGLLFNLWVKDVDCAFKLIRKKVLSSIDLKSDGAFISAELLIRAKKKGFKIKQVGVHHYPRLGGKPTGAKISVILKAFYELFKLWNELR